MRTIARQAILLFLAAWMPFCCCQARAVAQAIAAAQRPDRVEAPGAGCCGAGPAAPVPACCRTDRETTPACCQTVDADTDAPARCCGGEDGAPADHGNCCSACKDRVAPPAPADALHDAAELNALATMLLAEHAEAVRAAGHAAPAAPDTGPPPRPAGRAALERHSILVI